MKLKDFADKGMRYRDFIHLHIQLLAENKTTGHNQSETYLAYARLNQHRLERVDKTLRLEDTLIKAVEKLNRPITAIVITEGWCGDSAQNLPVLGALDALGKNFKVRIVLRDDNPELMNQYLTNGSKSIPKVIFIDDESGKELAVWGPRPAVAQKMMEEGKAKGTSKDEINTAIQLWYSKDKTQSLQTELVKIFEGF